MQETSPKISQGGQWVSLHVSRQDTEAVADPPGFHRPGSWVSCYPERVCTSLRELDVPACSVYAYEYITIHIHIYIYIYLSIYLSIYLYIYICI